MLQYDNESQLLIIFRMTGSVLPSSCLLGLLTFALGTVLAILRKRDQTIEIFKEENYLLTDDFFRIACTVVGFLLVMRTNQALNRWMHAVTQVEVMLSKWSDAYNALNSFFSGKDGTPATLERILLFRIRVAHWFSLMSCLAFATLKNGHVNNLAEVCISAKYPDDNEMLKTSFSKSGEFLEEGRTKKERRRAKHALAFEVLHAPTELEVAVLECCADKVNIIALWIVQGIMREVRDKTLDAPPPIVTRVFQEISRGMLGFHQAHKVAMVPFPFPFAQMVTMLLTLLYMAFPFFIDNFTQHVIITPIISFIIPVCFCSLNMLAIDLEVPFGTSMNCIDIMNFNQAFLDLLEDTLMQPQVPPTSEYAKLEREIIQGIDFNKPREDPVPFEGAALAPSPSFARTPDPLASAAVMPVASWNIPRSTEPAKMGADRYQSTSSANRVSGPRAAAQYHAQRRSSPPPPASAAAPAPEARLSTKVDPAPVQSTSARSESAEARLPFKAEPSVQTAARTSQASGGVSTVPQAPVRTSGRTSTTAVSQAAAEAASPRTPRPLFTAAEASASPKGVVLEEVAGLVTMDVPDDAERKRTEDPHSSYEVDLARPIGHARSKLR
mmetsp:Transcript_59008/g.108166  ORF Transcript_59008/g.108166 Transcript_59008/m.108166 type:complete len:611 (-) Transcript_59008:39-1871(-)